jgi:transcriptional regulator with XRE-family HTH domain
MKAFGLHLRTIRKSKGLSQEELAWKADLELSQISRIERGIINTSLSQILVIAAALGIPHQQLMDFEWTME